MKFWTLARAWGGVLAALAFGLGNRPAAAQAMVRWTAASNVAMSITGDIAVSSGRIVFANGASLTLHQERAIAGINDAPGAKGAPIDLYRVVDPRPLVLLHGNGLCAAAYVGFYATPAAPGSGSQNLYVSFFRGRGALTPANYSARICDSPYWYVAAPQGKIRAGFDCAKATSVVDRAICSDRALARLDLKMSRVYRAAIAAAGDKSGLLAQQRSFLAERSACGAPERGAPASKAALDACVRDLTASRVDELARAAQALGLAPRLGLTFAAPAWSYFAAHGTCKVINGRDGSDRVVVVRRGAAPEVVFDEFAYEGVGVLRPRDVVDFAVAGRVFPARARVDPRSKGAGRRFRTVSAASATSALIGAMKGGKLMRVERNGKTIFRSPLGGFGKPFARAQRNCAG